MVGFVRSPTCNYLCTSRKVRAREFVFASLVGHYVTYKDFWRANLKNTMGAFKIFSGAMPSPAPKPQVYF